MDICTMAFSSPGQVERLTTSSGLNGEPEAWDEHAQLSPSGDVIAYISSHPYGVEHNPRYGDWLRTDVWLMGADGSGSRRMTYFNEPASPEYLGRTVVADNSWNPAGGSSPQLVAAMYVAAVGEVWLVVIDFVAQPVATPTPTVPARPPRRRLRPSH